MQGFGEDPKMSDQLSDIRVGDRDFSPLERRRGRSLRDEVGVNDAERVSQEVPFLELHGDKAPFGSTQRRRQIQTVLALQLGTRRFEVLERDLVRLVGTVLAAEAIEARHCVLEGVLDKLCAQVVRCSACQVERPQDEVEIGVGNLRRVVHAAVWAVSERPVDRVLQRAAGARAPLFQFLLRVAPDGVGLPRTVIPIDTMARGSGPRSSFFMLESNWDETLFIATDRAKAICCLVQNSV